MNIFSNVIVDFTCSACLLYHNTDVNIIPAMVAVFFDLYHISKCSDVSLKKNKKRRLRV